MKFQQKFQIIVLVIIYVIVNSKGDTLQDQIDSNLDPLLEQDELEKDHSKRTIFSPNYNNFGWAKHVKLRGKQKIVLGYGPVDLKYVPVVKPILLKPINNGGGGWKFRPKPRPLRPLLPIRPVQKPIYESDNGWKPIIPPHVPAPPNTETRPWQEEGWSKPGITTLKPVPVPGFEQSGVGVQQPGIGVQQPGIGVQQPGIGMQQPGIGVQQPGVGVRPVIPGTQPTVPTTILRPVKPVIPSYPHYHVFGVPHVDNVHIDQVHHVDQIYPDGHVHHTDHIDHQNIPVLHPHPIGHHPQIIYVNPHVHLAKPQLPVLPLGATFPSNILQQTPTVQPIVPQVHPIIPDVKPTIPHIHPVIPNALPIQPHIHPLIPHIHPEVPSVPHLHPIEPHFHSIQPQPHLHPIVPQVHPATNLIPNIPHVPQVHEVLHDVPHIHPSIEPPFTQTHYHPLTVHPQIPGIPQNQEPPHPYPTPQFQPVPHYHPQNIPPQEEPRLNPGWVQIQQPSPPVQSNPQPAPLPPGATVEYHGKHAHLLKLQNQQLAENYNPNILPGTAGQPQDISNFIQPAQQVLQDNQQQFAEEEVNGLHPGYTDLQIPGYLPQHPNYT